MNSHSVPQTKNGGPHTSATVRPQSASRPLALAGKPRNQEANRKRIVQALRSVERESVRTAQKAGRIAETLAAFDAPTVGLNRVKTRSLLENAVHVGDEHVVFWIGRLLGIDRTALSAAATQLQESYGWPTLERAARMALKEHIRGERDLHAAHKDLNKAPSTAPAPATRSPIPDARVKSALQQAASIVRDAADAVVEIDWSQEPADDLERDARLAIIRQIEIEAAEQEAQEDRLFPQIRNGGSYLAALTLLSLMRLQPLGARHYGSDLRDAMERWHAANRVERMHRSDSERKRLLKAARQRIDTAPPEAA